MTDQDPSAPTLFYTPGTCAFAGIALMEWMALPYALCRVDREKRSSPAFLRINPHGKVPALRVGDRFLAENSAILLHLAARDPRTPYCPQAGTVAWDELQQWLSYLGSGFHAAFYPYFNPQRYLQDPAGFPALKAAAVLQIQKELAYVDGVLATRRWLLGDTRSLLDPYLFAMTRWAKPFCDMAREHPSIARHTDALSADAAIQFALAIERGDAGPAPSGALVRHETLLRAPANVAAS